jgi:hypothetical protein
MGPPEVEARGAELEKDRLGCHDTGEVGVLGEVLALFGGSVSQDRVRRQLARRIEKECEDIGSCVDV